MYMYIYIHVYYVHYAYYVWYFLYINSCDKRLDPLTIPRILTFPGEISLHVSPDALMLERFLEIQPGKPWLDSYLVGGLVAIFYVPMTIGLLVIPIDELIFFRGVALAHKPVI